MVIFTKSKALSTLSCIAVSVLLSGCGNKGDLFLPATGTILQQISTIDDALDELEAMEAEEEEEDGL